MKFAGREDLTTESTEMLELFLGVLHALSGERKRLRREAAL